MAVVEDFSVSKTSDSNAASSAALIDEVNKDRDESRKNSRPGDSSNNSLPDSTKGVLAPLEITGLDSEKPKSPAAPSDVAAAPSDSGPPVQTGRVILETQHYTADYRGEDIKREIAPEVVKDTKGKTLREIATAHLGSTPPPTEEEIQKHVNELARINHIKKPNEKLDGQPITAPGHDKYGGMITEDANGNKRTIYLNGDQVFFNKDGTGFDRKHSADGASYTEHHWGPYPRDNYDLRRTADGAYQISTDGGKTFPEKAEWRDPRVERAMLHDLAEGSIKDPEDRAKFESDMIKFAAREKELQKQYETQGMKPEAAQQKAREEVAKTYEQIGKLMQAGDNPDLPKIKSADRILLAQQVMHQAASPDDVSQGGYNTCNVASGESRVYTKSPSEAARLVTDIVTTGKYTSNGSPPTTVEVGKDKDIHPDSLLKVGESKHAHDVGANHRSYASQIFEVTAVNMHYHKENAANPPQKIRYEQHAPNGTDNGERLYDYSKVDPATGKKPLEIRGDYGEMKRAPNLLIDELSEVTREICPDPKDGDKVAPTSLFIDKDSARTQKMLDLDSEILSLDIKIKGGTGTGEKIDLDDPEAVKKAHQAIDEGKADDATKKSQHERLDALQQKNLYENRDGVAYIRDEKHLNEALAKFKKEGRLPIIVQVHTGAEPFRSDSGGGHGGQHVVTITDYDPGSPGPPPKAPSVKIDNQWNAESDHKEVPVGQLFKAMERVDDETRLKTIEKELADIKAAGKTDLCKETELLCAKRIAHKVSDQEVSDEMVKLYERMRKDLADGKMTKEQFAEAMGSFREMRSTLPVADQNKLNARLTKILQEEKKKKAA